MVEINPRLVFTLVFVSALAAFLWWDRRKISRHYILFYRRTERGIELIDSIASRFPRFWKYYGWAGVATGFASLALSFALMVQVLGRMLVTRSAENGPSLVLPGLVSQNQFQAGVSFVPFEYWVAGVGILMVAHEFSHGVVARAEGIELNSVGWIVMGVLPGAFVEPKGENMLPGDEENEDPGTGMWEQGSWKSRLKVLGAGSFANYITAAVFILLAAGTTAAVTAPSSVFYQVDEGFPAQKAGMDNGTLHQINGHPINTLEDLRNVSGGIEVGDTVTVWTSEGNFTVEATNRTGYEGGYIGIQVGTTQVVKDGLKKYSGGLQWFISLLYTVGMLNLLIGLFNMLPIKPLDGGLMVETLLKEYAPGRVEHLDRFSAAGWLVLLASIVFALVLGV